MSFTDAVKSCFSKYVTFSGRAPRSEYWYWALFTVIAAVLLRIIDMMVLGAPASSTGILGGLFSLATFLPAISVAVRRLHDINRSGWWYWIILTGIGIILLIVWFCTKGTAGPNRFGTDPLGVI